MPSRRILLVAPISPPAALSAAHRIGGMATYLSRLGHDVTVLTSVVSGSGAVAGATRTVRTRDLMVSPLNWRRRNFHALSSAGDAGYDATPSVLASVVVPDLELVGWVPFALARALRLARRSPPDCVITSSPPHSGHLIGLALQAQGIAWVSDFRDGWTFEPTRPRYPLSLQRRLDAALERLVVQHADAVVAVTPPIADDLRERLGAEATTVTNGFDPEEATSLQVSQAPLADDRRSLVYTGSLSYAGNSPEPLMAALDVLAREQPEIAGRLELVVAGPVTSEEREQLKRRAPMVRLVGRLPRPDTLELQRRADGLILIAGDHRPSVATGKLYEYLAARRPIIVLGSASVAARIVEETGAGAAIPEDDVGSIAAALARFVAGNCRLRRSNDDALARYAYPALAEEMATQVDVAIQRRRHTAGYLRRAGCRRLRSRR